VFKAAGHSNRHLLHLGEVLRICGQAGYPLHHQVVTGEGPRLVEAADLNLSRKGNPVKKRDEQTTPRNITSQPTLLYQQQDLRPAMSALRFDGM
jgi:hypothetical protein